jgi:hypothetical protein
MAGPVLARLLIRFRAGLCVKPRKNFIQLLGIYRNDLLEEYFPKIVDGISTAPWKQNSMK